MVDAMHQLGVAVVVAALLAVCTSASQVGDVGFDTSFPPISGEAPPQLATPFDTTLIAQHVPREAQLQCVQEAPIFRVVTCDIKTWDACGNVFGRRGNESDWQFTVQHATSNKFSRLVSPITFLVSGVARFYFTPVEIGVHIVTVKRRATSKMPSLNTGNSIQQLVIIHDTTARCTQGTVAQTHPQLRTLLWAQATHSNENAPIVGVSGISKNTHIVVDRDTVYAGKAGELQQSVRRGPLPPESLGPLGPQLPQDNNNFYYCDVIQRT